MSDAEQWGHDEQRMMENEITALRKQVEKLTKERDIKEHCIVQLEAEDLRRKEQLAALAEQNEKIRTELERFVRNNMTANACSKVIALTTLPNLATPVLNKYRAEGMRMAADAVDSLSVLIPRNHTEIACLLRARADELEKSL